MGQGEDDEIVKLYSRYHSRLIGFASLVAPESGMAEDLVQDAFIKVAGRLPATDDHEQLLTYFRVVIANLARSRARRLRVARRSLERRVETEPASEEVALRRAACQEVEAGLRALSPRQRECLVLRFYEGLSESEIATALGISIGSVRTHAHRGLRALATALETTKDGVCTPPAPAGATR